MMTPWDVTQRLFLDKLVVDDRTPSFIAAVGGYKIGVIADPSLLFLLQMLSSFLLQIVALQAFSVALWYGVIRQKSKSMAIVVGLGLIVPLSFILPVAALNLFDVRNTSIKFGFSLLPLLVPCKCTEALFGSRSKIDEQHTQSLTAYRYYAGFPQLPRLSEKGVLPLGSVHIKQVLKQLVTWYIIMALCYSILEPFGFRPFPQKTTFDDSFLPTLDPGRMYNSLAQCILFFSTLMFAMKGTGILCMTLGGHAVDHFVFDQQPIFCSTSPRDFWGNKWNTLIHHHLKVGVYKPIRKHGGSAAIATLGTFLVSALLHEFISFLQFFRTDTEVAENSPSYNAGAWGKHLVFFGWNGLLILLQDVLGTPILRVTRSWPSWVRSHLVILLAMPVGHCFMDDIVDGGFFLHLRPLVPLIIVEAV